MKNLILISIGLIISIPTFGGFVEDTVKREAPKFVSIESPFQNKFTNELI